MNKSPEHQKGGSAISTIITLVVVGYALFVGIQYVPQLIESQSINSILDRVRDTQRTDPANSVADAKAKVIRMLQINEMNDMSDSFSVTKADNGFTVTFKYNRELNLIYKTQPMHYEKSMHVQYR